MATQSVDEPTPSGGGSGDDDLTVTDEFVPYKRLINNHDDDDHNLVPLRCWDCNLSFNQKSDLYEHLVELHIKQLRISLVRLKLPPLKLTLKSTSDNRFEVKKMSTTTSIVNVNKHHDDALTVIHLDDCETMVRGAEPTPPPDLPPPPKIRIKPSGLLLKDALLSQQQKSIPNISPITKAFLNGDNNNDNILALFNNNNEMVKDLGFRTSDSDFLPMDEMVHNRQPHYPHQPVPPPPPTILHNGLVQNIQQTIYPVMKRAAPPPYPLYYHQPPPPPPPTTTVMFSRAPAVAASTRSALSAVVRQRAPHQQQQRSRLILQKRPLPPSTAPNPVPESIRNAKRSKRPNTTTKPNEIKKNNNNDDDDDDDCQLISIQPKNVDGNLPQIQSVQGGTIVEPVTTATSTTTTNNSNNNNSVTSVALSSLMHLSDSITLSMTSGQSSSSSSGGSKTNTSNSTVGVANILATRGITITPSVGGAPPPSQQQQQQKSVKSVMTDGASINSVVSILQSSVKNTVKAKVDAIKLPPPPPPQTVDLTNDQHDQPPPPPSEPSTINLRPPQPPPKALPTAYQAASLPFRCDLCPAQYPSALGLSKHRQKYHKTGFGGIGEMGVPLVNLRQAGIFQKLNALGITNYIPLPPVNGIDGTFALPIVNTKNTNVSLLGATTILTLGPIRNIPKPPHVGHNAAYSNSKTNNLNTTTTNK